MYFTVGALALLSIMLGVVVSHLLRLSHDMQHLSVRVSQLELARIQTRLSAYLEEPQDADSEEPQDADSVE